MLDPAARNLTKQLAIRVIVAWAFHAASLWLIGLNIAPPLLRPAALVAGIAIVCWPLVAVALAKISIREFAEPFGVMLIYVIPSLLFFAPFLKTFTTHVIGSQDSYQVMWDAWWIKQVFTAGKPLFFTDAVFAPVGAPLVLFLLPIQSTAIALLEPILGDALGFNIVAFLAIPLAGLGAYVLCRSMDYSKPASIAGGFVLAWSPFLTSKLHWLNLSYCGFLALFAAALVTALPIEGKPASVRTIALLALATLGVQFSGDVTVVFAVSLVVLRLLACSIRQRSVKDPLRQAIRVFAPAAIVLIPFIIVLVARLPEYWGSISRDASTYRYNPTAVNYLLPSAYWSMYGDLVKSLVNPGLRSGDMSCYLGLLVFPMAVLGGYATRQRIETRFWVGVGALFLILSFGPYMFVNGTRILLPFAIWSRLPFLGSVAQSGRYIVLVYLAMAIGVAAWLSVRRTGTPYLLAAILAIAADFAFVPTTVALPPLPPLTATSGAVIDVRIYTGETMYYQTKHGRPLVGGYLPRTPRSARMYYDSSPCIDWLMSATPLSPCDPESMGRALANLNVTDVFTRPDDRRQAELIRLGFQQSYQDSRSAVWLPPSPPSER